MTGAGAVSRLTPDAAVAPQAIGPRSACPTTRRSTDNLSGITVSRRPPVYVARQGNSCALFARDLDGSAVSRLAGSDGASMPFFSPNGEWSAVFWPPENSSGCRLPAAYGGDSHRRHVGDDLHTELGRRRLGLVFGGALSWRPVAGEKRAEVGG